MIKLVKLHFKAPLHLGQAGLGLEESSLILHSDTLYSGIFQAWLRLYGEPLPEIILTSAFPFIAANYYFPRPFLPAPGYTSELAIKYGKALKRTSFISQEHFARWVQGIPLDFEQLVEESKLLGEVMGTGVRAQVALDRLHSNSALYFVGETFFAQHREAGLFFLVDLPPEYWPNFQAALKMLGEEGIGGRRSLGYGIFEPEFIADFSLIQIDKPDAYLTLSLVYPAGPDEVQDNLIAYQLVERMGWLEDKYGNLAQRHQRVLMFSEGSVFRRPVRGRLVDVAPPGFKAHPVYRNGLAFNVGVRLEAGVQ
ncbi:type III-A CRISPR-associated RAMP protein Csm4 [Neomoorella thermoacetica]|uniref:type III-A CRISPR-associated RAMP protein Csm4 n=1 Tax=Neomoorella thermoacetica TaxID=1525 RepID=UPI0030D2CB3D